MDENIKILLNSNKNVDSINVDSYHKIELNNRRSPILEYDIRNVLSATEIFDIEREANEVYRIYGKIEYMSLLNGLRSPYSRLEHFFSPVKTGNFKDIRNSFDFYLVAPATGYTNITGISSTIQYIRYFKVIATPKEFELYPVGFANNLYGEQAYGFGFNIDFDVSDYFDDFGFPATELYLYAQYKKVTNPSEGISASTWTNNGILNRIPFLFNSLNIGDYLKTSIGIKIGDIVEYSKLLFIQEQHTPQTFYISTPYIDGSTIKRLIWKYNPFIPFRLRYFSDEIYRANSGTTSYEQRMSIPNYATLLNDGNYVWRTILPQGYTDPLTGIGVDYPFVNKRRYLFSNIVLDIIPDLNDANTLAAFNEIKFNNPGIVYTKPVNNLNNIGKPCL